MKSTGLRSLLPTLVTAGIILSVSTATAPHASAQSIGSDEFNGFAGAAPSSQFWNYDVGGGGWGNNELQTYTSSRANSKLDGKGNLVITAVPTANGYTSARLVTRGKVDFRYGLVEARIKFPSGKGLLPAMWMLGSNIGQVGWPACGEIDAMEVLNTGTQYHAALHGPTTASPGAFKQNVAGSIPGVDLAADFHTYGIYREPGLIRITIDSGVIATYTRSTIPAGATWVFDGPMYLNLNIAVGGNWPGSPDSSTAFPATMLVDWVRYSA